MGDEELRDVGGLLTRYCGGFDGTSGRGINSRVNSIMREECLELQYNRKVAMCKTNLRSNLALL